MDALLDTLAWVGSSGRRADELEHLIAALRSAEDRPLVDPQAPPGPGIYALYLRGRRDPVYVGKTEGHHGLRGRLAQHVQTLRHHPTIDLAQVRCRFVCYARRAPIAYLEAALIRVYRPPWNLLVGFGSGRARKGLPPVGHWEERYPRAERAVQQVSADRASTWRASRASPV